MTIFSSFSALSQLSSINYYHTVLAINCVHASNLFTHLQQAWQTDGHNDNSVFFTFFVVECDMWQSRVEIEHYSVAYFDRITTFKVL